MSQSKTPPLHISNAAITKLRQLTKDWNATNPERRTSPAIYVRRLGSESDLTLGVGFIENSDLERNVITKKKYGMNIIIDFSNDDLELLKGNVVHFDGKRFEFIKMR